ncbi:MAG: HAD-IA family hydrolase [Acidimicrobiia bacterium]|nr:HAD-IA family hydrolase [Acidimicrobiia bacterium]
MSDSDFRAVFFDFGGVVLTSPFEAFERYERAHGLPVGFIRAVNSTNPDDNAWARLERNEVGVDGFVPLFEAEAEALGHRVDGYAVITMLAGTVRPVMVDAIDTIGAAGLTTACLTNNFAGSESDDADSDRRPIDRRTQEEKAAVAAALERFDFIVESSVVGVRKPEPDFYRRALDLAGVEPTEVVFLDDLGVNLKPARAMGMSTIKVVDPIDALTELGDLLGLELLQP